MDAHATPTGQRRIGYHAMRMLRFRRALRDFVRRWGLYLLIGAGVLGAGSNAPLSVVAAAASLLLWPMRTAANHGGLLVPATLAYALVGMLPVMLTRPLWWPRQWADAERALPIAAREIDRSDRIFGALLMLPWQALQVAGWIGIVSHEDVAQDALHRWLAVGGWSVAAAGSLWLSLRWMRFVRRPLRPGIDRAPARRSRGGRAPSGRVLGAGMALVVLPLLRGQARGSAWLLATVTLAIACCASLAWWTRLSIGWVLALVAVLALTTTSLLRADTTRTLRPSWRGARHLPLDDRNCERARRTVTLIPALFGVVAGVVAAWGSSAVRPTAVALYALALALGCGIESGEADPMDPTHQAARWLLLLATAIACGSEVAPS